MLDVFIKATVLRSASTTELILDYFSLIINFKDC